MSMICNNKSNQHHPPCVFSVKGAQARLLHAKVSHITSFLPCLLVVPRRAPWVETQQAHIQPVQSSERQVPAPTSIVRLLMK